MTPAALRSWRKRLGLTQLKASQALGIKKRLYEYWEDERDPREPHVGYRLAMAALALGLTDYDGAE